MIHTQVLVASIWLWPLLSAAPHQQLQVATITPIVAINRATPVKTEFNFGVMDASTSNFHGRQEMREGDRVDGSYIVLLPNGRVQRVEYFADATGFHPQVSNADVNVNRINGVLSGGHFTSTTADEDSFSTTTPIPSPLQSLFPNRLGLADVFPGLAPNAQSTGIPLSRLGLTDGFPALSPNTQSTGIPLSSTTSQGSQPLSFGPVVTNPEAQSIFSSPSSNITNALDANYDYLDVLVVSNPGAMNNNSFLNNPLNVNPNFFDFDYILDEILNTTDSSITPIAPRSDIPKSIQKTSNVNDFQLLSKLIETMNNNPIINAIPNLQGNNGIILPNLTPSLSGGVPLSATAPATVPFVDSSIGSVSPTSAIPNSIPTSSTANDLQLIKKLLETMSRVPIINDVPNPPNSKGVPLPFPSPPIQTDVLITPTAESVSGDSKLGLPFSPSAPLVVNTGGVPLPSGDPLSLGVPLSSGVPLSPSAPLVSNRGGVPLSSVDPLPSGVPFPSGVPLPSGGPLTSGVPLSFVNLGSPSSAGFFQDIPTFPNLGINEDIVKAMLEGRLQNPLGTTVFIIGQPQGEQATSATKPKPAAVAPSGSGKQLSNPRAPSVISPNPPFGGTLLNASPTLGTPFGTPFSKPVVSPYHSYPNLHQSLPVSSAAYGSPYIQSPHYGSYGDSHHAGSPYRHYRIRVRRPVKEKPKGKGWDYYYKGFKSWFDKDDKKDSDDIIVIQKQPQYSSYPTSGTYALPHPYTSSGSYGIPHPQSYHSPLYSSNHPFGRGALSGSAALSGSSVLGDPRFNSPLGFSSPLGFRSPLGGGVAFGRLGIPADDCDDISDSLELLDAGSGGFGGGIGSGGSGGLGGSGGCGGSGSNGGLSGIGGNGGIGGFSGNGGSGVSGGLGGSSGSGGSGGSLAGGSGSGGSVRNQGVGVTLADVTGGGAGSSLGSGVGSGVGSGGVGSGVGSIGVGSGGVTIADTTAGGGGVSTTGVSSGSLGQNTGSGGSISGSRPVNGGIGGSANLGTASVGSVGTGITPAGKVVGVESSSGNVGTSLRDSGTFTPSGAVPSAFSGNPILHNNPTGAIPLAFSGIPIAHHHPTGAIPTAFNGSPIQHHNPAGAIPSAFRGSPIAHHHPTGAIPIAFNGSPIQNHNPAGAIPSAFRGSPIAHHHPTGAHPSVFSGSPIHHYHHGYYPVYTPPSEHIHVPVNRHKYKKGHHHVKGHYHKGYKGTHTDYTGYNSYKGYKGYKGFNEHRTAYRTSQYAPSYASLAYSSHPGISYGSPSYGTHAYKSPISHPSIRSHY